MRGCRFVRPEPHVARPELAALAAGNRRQDTQIPISKEDLFGRLAAALPTPRQNRAGIRRDGDCVSRRPVPRGDAIAVMV
jgi:hypothetical protein